MGTESFLVLCLLDARVSRAYHLRYLREDATDPELFTEERLAVVLDRAV